MAGIDFLIFSGSLLSVYSIKNPSRLLLHKTHTDGRIKLWSPSVRPTRQLEIRVDPTQIPPATRFQFEYFAMADGCRSRRSFRPDTLLTRATDYHLHTEASLFVDKPRARVFQLQGRLHHINDGANAPWRK